MPADKTIGDKQAGRRRSALRRRPAEEAETTTDELEAVDDEESTHAITAKKDRPTPSRRREEEAEEDRGNIVTRTVGGFREYVDGVFSEIKKVSWPTREETRRLTVIVLISLIIAAIFLGVISLFFTELFRLGLDTPLLLFGFMIIAIAAGLIYNRMSSRKTTTL
jgi:preprotein translocase subunit SecE